ncbi:MAG: hypothetical protein JXN61_01720 [Sedimentisphaerales bacterium]|nr:hypothetical protein [Sedimentisphaerales bacterium]
MSKRIPQQFITLVAVMLLALLSSAASADWTETFGGNAFDQAWEWDCWPRVTGTFTHVITDGPDDNDYISINETTKLDEDAHIYGSGFGIGFVTDQSFSDVRVGTVVNVAGDAAKFYHGMGARAGYFLDNGSISGVPGIIASAYIMHINWEDWPPRFMIDIEKVIWNYNAMAQGFDVVVPGLGNGGSFYAALDIIGTNPTYVTGYLYEYEGGPLVAKTATLIDTDVLDSWENVAHAPRPPHNDPFLDGYSGIFAQNERSNPPGYHTTFDDVSSVSQGSKGPVAVYVSPADGATDVDINVDLEWVESSFATSRELWFGKEGAMRPYSPAGTSYDPGTLEFGQRYQWRVDQTVPGGKIEGIVGTFTTEGTSEGCLMIDDFESYDADGDIMVAWPDDIEVWDYTYLETFTVFAGAKAMRFEWQNQFDPYKTTLTHTFTEPQNWTMGGLAVLSLNFRGEEDNYEQKMFVGLEDNVGHSYEVPNPYNSYAVQTESWQRWNIELSEFSGAGVDLSQVKKISIRVGDGTPSGQPDSPADSDMIYIDQVQVCPLKCSLNLRADVDGNCRVDFGDFSSIANDWLSEGEYELP